MKIESATLKVELELSDGTKQAQRWRIGPSGDGSWYTVELTEDPDTGEWSLPLTFRAIILEEAAPPWLTGAAGELEAAVTGKVAG